MTLSRTHNTLSALGVRIGTPLLAAWYHAERAFVVEEFGAAFAGQLEAALFDHSVEAARGVAARIAPDAKISCYGDGVDYRAAGIRGRTSSKTCHSAAHLLLKAAIYCCEHTRSRTV